MSRISWGLVLLLLFLIPLPGLSLFINISFALEHSTQIKGKVIDAESKASIEYAIVSLLLLPDTIPFQYAASDLKGNFSFINLKAGNYSIIVHFMGFKNYKTQPISISGKESIVRLDPIPITIENVSVGEINVIAKSGNPVYQLGKKTIYTENQLSGAGGTASDLLHKLPSVTQGPDGSTAINGNSHLLVIINGKPSSLKGDELLQNTPASELKKMELITSPSAKYDASGSGGIINLITRKSTLQGLNGNVQVATDQLGGYSSDVLLNYKYNNLSLFGGLDQNRRRAQADIDYATNYITDKSQFNKSGTQKSERINTGFRTGLDYQSSAASKFSISANGGRLTINNNGNWETVTTKQSRSVPDQNMEADDNHKSGQYGGADVSYEFKFDSLKKTASFSALWNTLGYEDNYLNQINDLTGTEKMKQSTILNRIHNNCQFNADYITPAGKTGTFEVGYQIAQNNENETYQSTISNPLPPAITNQETQFKEIIQAGYGTWQYKHNQLDFKAGLRAENLNRRLTTLNNQYPLQRFNLYPTLNSSFKIDSIEEIHFNYTRRTDQLKTTQLDPLPRWYDFYNVQIGNPNLKNEITDKIALDYQANFPHLTLSNELFYYTTDDKIEMIHSVYQNGIIQNQYENTGTEKTFGFEFNADWTTSSWLSLNQKIAFIDTKLNVRFDEVSQQKKYNQFYTETTADFRLSPSSTLQVDFSYYGPQMTAQSSIDQFYIAGISYRQTFFNKKLTFSLTGRDFLGMYKKVEHIQTDDFNQDVTTLYKFPIRFSLSYKFNHYKRDEKRNAKTPVME